MRAARLRSQPVRDSTTANAASIKGPPVGPPAPTTRPTLRFVVSTASFYPLRHETATETTHPQMAGLSTQENQHKFDEIHNFIHLSLTAISLHTDNTNNTNNTNSSPTLRKDPDMAAFSIELANQRVEEVCGVDAYQQEGPLTTFFAVESQRLVIDSWSTRVASFRTADIVTVRRS